MGPAVPKAQELPVLASKKQSSNISLSQSRFNYVDWLFCYWCCVAVLPMCNVLVESEPTAEPPKPSQKKKVRRETWNVQITLCKRLSNVSHAIIPRYRISFGGSLTVHRLPDKEEGKQSISSACLNTVTTCSPMDWKHIYFALLVTLQPEWSLRTGRLAVEAHVYVLVSMASRLTSVWL